MGSTLALGCATGHAGMELRTTPTPCAGNPSSDPTILDPDSVSVAPRLRRLPALIRPTDFMAPGDSGYVIVTYVVNADGSVDLASVAAVGASSPGLAAQVVEAFRQATFWPGCKGDVAVRVRARQTMQFEVSRRVRRSVVRRPGS